MAASLAAIGVVMAWLGYYFRDSDNSASAKRFFWIVSGICLLFGAPSAAMNRLTFSETYVEQSTGPWFAPKVYHFEFANISSIRLKFARPPSDGGFTFGSNSHGPRWQVVVTFKDKTTTTFAAFRAWRDQRWTIASYLAARGVEFKDGPRLGTTPQAGAAPRNEGLAIFDPQSPPFYLAVVGMAIAWFVLLKLVFVRLEARHPQTFEAIAKPTLSLRNNFPASLAVFSFVMERKHRPLRDRYLSTLCDVMLVLFFVYLIAFSILFIGVMLSPRHG